MLVMLLFCFFQFINWCVGLAGCGYSFLVGVDVLFVLFGRFSWIALFFWHICFFLFLCSMIFMVLDFRLSFQVWGLMESSMYVSFLWRPTHPLGVFCF